ncbi:MAG: PQQ-binding-like beta-propeller repeat protein [Candidatus Omnitrophota bacterium]
MNFHKIVCGLAVLFLLSASSAFADDWPMLGHDLGRTSYSSDKISSGNYSILWNYTPPADSTIVSSPIVANGKVFIGLAKIGGGSLLCFKEPTGELLWNYYTDGYESPGEVTVADGKVFGTAGYNPSLGSYGRYAYLFCLDESTGNLRWKTGATYSGWNSSPAVVGDRILAVRTVYSVSFLSSKSYLVCFSKDTGEQLWSKEIIKESGYTPYVAVSDGKVFLIRDKCVIEAWDCDSGNLVWVSYYIQDYDRGSPKGICVSEGRVFITVLGGYNYKRNLVLSLDAATGEPLWQYHINDYIIGKPTVAYGKVFVGLDRKGVIALERETGNLLKEYPVYYLASSHISVADEKLFVANPWTIYAIDIESGATLWSYYMGGGTSRHPITIANGKIFKHVSTVLNVFGHPNHPPIANAGTNITINSEDQPNTIIIGTTEDEDGDVLQYTWLQDDIVLRDYQPVESDGSCPLSLADVIGLDIGQYTLTLEVNDGTDTVWSSMILTINNSPPVIAPGGSGVYQVGEDIILTAQVSDYDGDTLSYSWKEGTNVFNSGTVTTFVGGSPVDLFPYTLTGGLPLGEHTITLEVNDGINSSVCRDIAIKMIDSQAPTLKPTVNTSILWPPNHQMADIVINANAEDNSGVVHLSADVTSSEPAETDGDGNTVSDYTEPIINQATGIIILQLRAERSGKGTGRIYTIAITASDDSGNSSSAEVEVIAPHDRGKKNKNRVGKGRKEKRKKGQIFIVDGQEWGS